MNLFEKHPLPWSVDDDTMILDANKAIVFFGGDGVHHVVQRINATQGVPQDAFGGGWTAAGASAYASRLEKEVAAEPSKDRHVIDAIYRLNETLAQRLYADKTLLDEFAMAAFAMLPDGEKCGGLDANVHWAYQFAQAMMAEKKRIEVMQRKELTGGSDEDK